MPRTLCAAPRAATHRSVAQGDNDDGFKEAADYNNAPIQEKADPRTKTTVRNLRIREDTAKYLHNLDVNSAYYDPSAC